MEREEIERLEMKVSYLELDKENLSSSIIDLSREIEKLRFELKALEKKVAYLEESEERPNRKPPHY